MHAILEDHQPRNKDMAKGTHILDSVCKLE